MTEGNRVPIILDVDTGVDDALALAYAANRPDLDLVAVTTVAGNVDIARATENTRRVLAYLGRDDVPVHRGASRPLARSHRPASYAHGHDGLGGVQLPAARRSLEETPGPATIIRLARERPGELTLVAVGPLTNLAIALNVEPRIAEWIPSVVVMGGAFRCPGNITALAEYNIWEDPEAAAQVFEAPFASTTLIGLDVTMQVGFARATAAELAKRGELNPAADLAVRVSQQTWDERGLDQLWLHDPLAVAVAAEPGLVGYSDDAVEVVVTGEAEGQTKVAGPGRLKVATSVDVDGFLQRFHSALGADVVTS
ncbi:MAG TPA: nucleoside hydrolase [Thermomicrobiales bacterium]|jgi:inosine-uridine nucleoside N-ribohydrolase|nr:nucleoside hydrolase [Thermomicrobiales bacterium]